MTSPAALEARAQAYRRQEAIALGMIRWCTEQGVRPDTFHQRAEEAKYQAARAERQLRRITR